MSQDFTLRGADQDVLVRMARQYAEQAEVEALTVSIEADGLTCRRDVLTLGGDGLDHFFSDLARDWRGWDGARRWDALEHGMTIEATHTGRRVVLLLTLRRDYEPDAWEVRVPLSLAPGEPLSEAAADMHRLWE